jgi:hypothetical protein
MKILKAFFLLTLLLSGCNNGNFSPRLKQNNNSNEQVNNNQNGFLLELGKIRKETEILGSKLREIQEGLLNLNAAVSRNENSGVQILQGDGALIFIFSLCVLVIVFYYKNKNSQEVSKVLAKKIVDLNNPEIITSLVDELSIKNKEKEFVTILKKLNG